ncbi:MAG: hypothetical protein FJ319_07475 [SAR202 cluster bacterium]|nr:hypothetical protein [SAR202 cluster bacterium]
MREPRPVTPGLCESCEMARAIRSGKGSVFWLCGRHESDPGFPKYPRLPVVRCEGYAPGLANGGDRR